MARRQLRGIVLACCAGGALLTMASESQGCYFLQRLFGCAPAPTYYAPPACAPAPMCAPCNPCAQPACPTPMCAPQATYYQPMYRPAPVMAMMPVAASPCSACAVTSYRPVRAWTYQANLMPYTNYRVTYSNPCPTTYSSCAPCVSCPTGGCPTGGCPTGGCPTGGCPTGGCPTGGCSATYYSGSVSSSYETPGTPMPSPSDMSQPPAESQPSCSVPSSQTPTYAPEQPGSGAQPAPTPAPGTTAPAPSPPAPSNEGLPQPKLNSSTTMLYPNTLRDRRPAALPLQQPIIQNVPPIGGPQLMPAPPVRPGVEDRRASRTTHQAVHFDLIPSPPQPMPVHPAVYDRPASALPPGMDHRQVNDGGWQGVE